MSNNNHLSILLHNNPCGLFDAKSCIYIYIYIYTCLATLKSSDRTKQSACG